jgi:hypothetical protein
MLLKKKLEVGQSLFIIPMVSLPKFLYLPNKNQNNQRSQNNEIDLQVFQAYAFSLYENALNRSVSTVQHDLHPI